MAWNGPDMTVSSENHIEVPIALTIAGSDSGGNAGIQADLMTFAAHNVFGSSAIAATTAQNPASVTSVETSSVSHLTDQIRQVMEYFPVKVIKIGMLANADLVHAVAAILTDYRSRTAVVLDPVMVSTSGAMLLATDAVQALITHLIPLATVVTPNLDEARVILNCDTISYDNLIGCAAQLSDVCQTAVFLKGGHLPGKELIDVLHTPYGSHQTWKSQRIESVDTHGSGCTLSSAIAANLALDYPLTEAIDRARNYLLRGMQYPVRLSGRDFINHFPPG